MVVKQLGNKLIDAEITTGRHAGRRVFIPRISLSPSSTQLPFCLKRRQFPIRSAFAMSINKSQGQTLGKIGLYLSRPVFTHGQLYVALSRTTSFDNITLMEEEDKTGYVTNIVYHSALV
jgi:ATP-dependent DNA helicase PIF1